MDCQIKGLDALVNKIGQSPDKLLSDLKKLVLRDAEELAGRQREKVKPNTPTGMLRESIQSYFVQEGDMIEAGSRTNLSYAVFVEFGTGPKGDEKGHPLDDELGVVRKQEGWVANMPFIGFRHTDGQPAQAFMYMGMKEMQPKIKEHFGVAAKEAIKIK